MMALRTALPSLTLLYCCFSWGVSGTQGCEQKGPTNCGFQKFTQKDGNQFSYSPVLCGWKVSNFHCRKTAMTHFSWNYALRLNHRIETGELTSRTACSTRGETHCLMFFYLFRTGNAFDLSVSVKYEGSDDPEPPVWTLSSNPDPFPMKFFFAKAPIRTDNNFQVVFTARKRPGVSAVRGTVWIDDIYYMKTACPVQPLTAKPPTRSTSNPIMPLWTSTAAGDERVPKRGKTSTGLIAAIIIITLIIITTIVIVVWFRRKRRAKADRSAANACNHVISGRDDAQDSLDVPSVSSASNLSEERQASSTQSLDLSNLAGSSDDDSFSNCPELTTDNANFITRPQRSSSRVRLKGNSATFSVRSDLDQIDRADLPTGSDCGRGRDHPDIGSLSAVVRCPRDPFCVDPNRKVCRDSDIPEGGKDKLEGAFEDTGNYNRLDFVGSNAAGGTDGGAAHCNVYNYVCNQGEDTYCQVDGNTRIQIIDNVYSHLDGQEDIYRHVDRSTRVQVIDNVYSHLDADEDIYRQVNRSTRVQVIDNVYSHLDDLEDTTAR